MSDKLRAHDHAVLDCPACQDRQNDQDALRAEIARLRGCISLALARLEKTEDERDALCAEIERLRAELSRRDKSAEAGACCEKHITEGPWCCDCAEHGCERPEEHRRPARQESAEAGVSEECDPSSPQVPPAPLIPKPGDPVTLTLTEGKSIDCHVCRPQVPPEWVKAARELVNACDRVMAHPRQWRDLARPTGNLAAALSSVPPSEPKGDR